MSAGEMMIAARGCIRRLKCDGYEITARRHHALQVVASTVAGLGAA
ncbi:MAG TPA: hypothetical protein VIR56_07150 [Solimonas sp.]